MQSSKRIVAGVDEVGRGPLAGPVVACALVFLLKPSKLSLFKFGMRGNLKRLSLRKLRDSKQLSPRQREEWYRLFLKSPHVQWGIGRASERTIDKINIYRATQLAMVRAVVNLTKKLTSENNCYSNHITRVATIDSLILDGNFTIDTPLNQKAIIRGDEKVPQCAAASIVAKVTRDRLMVKYHRKYPLYGFDQHKGYGTKKHLAALRRHGPCKIHRKTFSPIASLKRLRSP